MNLNSSLIQKKKNRYGFGIPNFKTKQVMGPPSKPAPKTRSNKQKSNSTPSSGTHWGKSCLSVLNSSAVRSTSTTISNDESRVIIAMTEGRGDARCEVGLASIDLSLPTLILCQISDSQSYTNTLTKINILNPTDIIVPATLLECKNRLIEAIRQKFPNIKILGTPRKNFNKNNGMDRILQLCLPSINTICVGLQHKYYALAAASALTTYLQNNLNIYYTKASLNVTYQESEGYAVIDVSTADRLELVSSMKPTQATRFSTLFGVLNHCVTRVGARLLRSTILQPPSSPPIIESTSQCVSELIKHPEVLVSIRGLLQRVAHIDQLLTITSMTHLATDSCSARQLNYLLLLNGLIDLMEPLKDVVENCQHSFFKEMKNTLASDNFAAIGEKLRTTIHPSAQFARSEAGVTQRCFAIKSDINGLLDLVRKTYSERLNDLNEYVRLLGNKYNLPLTLANNNTKGYHIVLKLNNQQKRTLKKSDLPAEFQQVYRLAGSCTMKTVELINLSTRLEDIMREILKISNSMIYNIIVDLKQYIGFFYKLCEDIARLDMFQSLAEASRCGRYVRPKFGEFTELSNARHPMLEMLIGDQKVPNPISICKDFNVQIITGPNGSGKSIYIRQVMLLQIMAQVGCYVPADSAMFRPMNRMFARIYLEDDMEYGASSFILEMKEVKYMMSLSSENSLFIIDELCRSTASDEGAALAFAICEKFCTTPAFLYVTTHYTSLANLANTHLNVKTWQMETEAQGDTPQDLVLDYKFNLIPGVTNLRHYGVFIVKRIWPESILQEVYAILDSRRRNNTENQVYNAAHEAIRLKYRLESDLSKLKSVRKLKRAVLNNLLNDYQNELEKLNINTDLLENQDNRQDFDFQIDDVPPAPNHEDVLETSSYQNLSNFLHEDSDNINMLIPEVSIASSDRELLINDSETANQSNFEQKSEVCDENKTQITPSTTLWGNNVNDLSEIEISSIMEELDSARESLLEDEEDFFTQESYHTAEMAVITENPSQHIFPNVKVIEGPQWSQDSSLKTIQDQKNESFDSQSISYSPLCSQSSVRPEEQNENIFPTESVAGDQRFSDSSDSESISYSPLQSQSSKINMNKSSSNPQTSTSSPLQFISRNKPINDNIVLSDISTIRDTDNRTSVLKSSSTEKPSDSSSKQPRKRRPKRFIPPKKLTKKEIEEEFNEQDRKIYESDIPKSDLPKYLSKILNRPSVRQVQGSRHVAFVRRTDDGVEVIPALPEKKTRICPFRRNLSNSSSVDVSIFSDKNAKRFDEFVNSEERDVKRFRFNFDTQDEDRPTSEFNFQPQSFSENAPPVFSFTSQNSVTTSEMFHSLTPITPDGYYKRNQEDIANIVNKYLGEENIFETGSLNENDLDL